MLPNEKAFGFLRECKLAKRLVRLREKLSLSKEQVNPHGETSAPPISRPYAPKAKAQLISAQVSELLLSIEPAWAIGAVAFVYLSVLNIVGGYSWLGLIAMVLPFLARWASRGYLSQRTPFDLPIGLLLVAGLIGIGVSSDRSLSWDVYQTCLVCVLFYYSFTNYDRPRLLMKWGLLVAAVAVLVLGGYVFLQVPTSLPLFSQLQTWLNPNPPPSPTGWIKPPLSPSASGATVGVEVVTVLLAGVALFPGRKRMRIGAAILTVLLLGVLVISTSRATWLVLAVGMLFLLGWRSRWLLLSIPAWVGVVWWSLTARLGYGWDRAWEVLSTLGGRTTERWPVVADAIADHPLSGGGLGGYALPYSHNAYLQFYLDFGLLGAVALIVAAAIFLRMAFQMRNKPRHHPWLGITVGAWVAILLGAVYSVIETAPACVLAMGEDSYYYAISPLFAILGAALVVTYRSLAGQSPSPDRWGRNPDEV